MKRSVFSCAIVFSTTSGERMDRFWLKSYSPGVPSDIDPSVYPSVVALLEESFNKFREQRAYVCMDKAITFRELDQMSQQMGAWLQSRGLKQGARVAIMMPNVLQYPVALAAALRAGYTVVNVNPLYTAKFSSTMMASAPESLS